MKALNVNNRKVEDFREDGRALFNGSQWQTTYESPSDPELEGINYFVDGKPYYTGKEN